MKPLLVVLCALFAGSTLFAQAPATPPQPKAPAKEAVKKGTTKKEAVKKEAAKKEDEMGKIDGTELARPNGTFLGLTLAEGKFKIVFYDKKKKPMKVDVLRATARWPNVHGPGQNRTVLNVAGDGTYLQGAQFVRGPYSFKLFIALIKSEDGSEAETYSVEFRG